jgi:hypothetical protein
MEPVALKRVFFWVFYALGTLILAFGLLLMQVPRTRLDKDFRFELIVWAICSGFLFTALLLARRILDERTWEHEGQPGEAYRTFDLVARTQLVFSAYFLVVYLIHSL